MNIAAKLSFGLSIVTKLLSRFIEGTISSDHILITRAVKLEVSANMLNVVMKSLSCRQLHLLIGIMMARR